MSTQRTFKKVASILHHYFFWILNYYLLPHSKGAFKKINRSISSLPHITRGRHLFGSIEWRYKGKSIGHMHGNRVVDIRFPEKSKRLSWRKEEQFKTNMQNQGYLFTSQPPEMQNTHFPCC